MSDDLFRIYSEVGKDGYPVEWHTLKHVVREQAGHRCIRCLHPYRNGEHGSGEWSPCSKACQHAGPYRYRTSPGADWTPGVFNTEGLVVPRLFVVGGAEVEAQWRILTVHHLSGEKTDCRWWNLAALCQRCHLQVQGKVVMARVWPWEHSEWFRPYVAGYYASVYLGEELSREQTMARLDELLALERAA